MPMDSVSVDLATWSVSQSNSTRERSTASTLKSLDTSHQCPEWRPSLDELQTPSGNLDTLHTFIDSWDDDDMLHGDGHHGGSRGDGDCPRKAQLATSSSPHHTQKVNIQGSMPSKSSVSARRASAVGSRPESEYGASCRRDDEASTSAPAAKRVCRENESEYWKCATAKSTVSSEIACSEQRWKQIARCQEELLAESKRESAALRNEYAINRKIVREMRKLVLKRATQHKDFGGTLDLLRPQNPLLVFTDSHQTFHRLLLATEPMIGELAHVESILASQRLQRDETLRDCHVQGDPQNPSSVDIVNSYVLPFDHPLRALQSLGAGTLSASRSSS
ncbi:hypothetical protein Gpo141_00003748 [Globisporangium polare]